MPAVSDDSEASLRHTLGCDCRFALDHLLRQVGHFRIWRRPARGEAIWLSQTGREVAESVALRSLRATAVDDARYAQELYLNIKYGGDC